MIKSFELCCLISVVVAWAGCGGEPESVRNDALKVNVTINVKVPKGRAPELDSIALLNEAGEGVASELPSGGSISTRVLPGTYKVVAFPSSSNPNATKIVGAKYQSATETPWSITVDASGGKFDLMIE